MRQLCVFIVIFGLGCSDLTGLSQNPPKGNSGQQPADSDDSVSNRSTGSANTKRAASGGGKANRWAILIGVDDYIDFADLNYCGADMTALQKQLIASGFDERQIFLLNDNVKSKKDLPLKANIDKQIATVLKLVEPDDLVLLAFSGHGVQLGTTAYLCPTDAKLKGKDDPDPASLSCCVAIGAGRCVSRRSTPRWKEEPEGNQGPQQAVFSIASTASS